MHFDGRETIEEWVTLGHGCGMLEDDWETFENGWETIEEGWESLKEGRRLWTMSGEPK